MSTPPFLDLPPGVRRVTLAAASGGLQALRADPQGARRGTVLLVPGFTGSKEDFVAVLAPLASRGWTAVAYDQRGQFESHGPDDESAYTLTALAADLLDVLAGLGPEPVHVVGHSFGGLVSREAALASSGNPFASLTLLCSGPSGLPSNHHDGLGALRAALPHVPLEVVYDVKESQDLEGGWRPPSEEIAAFMRRRFVSNNAWALRSLAGILLDTPDRTDELAALALDGLSVAVAYGPGDDVWPLAQQDAVAAALGTTSVVIPDAGHSPAADAPGATTDALDSILRGVAPVVAG